MSYYGENNFFSFRDNFCESLPDTVVDSTAAADFGRVCGRLFRRICAACESDELRPVLYAFCGGIADVGCDIFVTEKTDCASFRYGIRNASAECGVYLSGEGCIKLTFFDNNGFPMKCGEIFREFGNTDCSAASRKGRISTLTALRELYTNSIRDAIVSSELPFSAGISCGNKAVRSLWLDFFSGQNDNLFLQISDDGQRVNAYSLEFGFISYERLILAYCAVFGKNHDTVYLPDSFHFAAEEIAGKYGFSITRFSSDNKAPDGASEQRFLNDSLFMCARLFSSFEEFIAVIGDMRAFSSAKREICVEICGSIGKSRIITDKNGRIILSQSGKNRLSLTAQAYDSETAAELCSLWDSRLRRFGSCTNLFH